MTLSLARPLSPLAFALLSAALVVALGLYCLTYQAAQGHNETLASAFGWPIVNILPFILAFEWGKRAAGALRLPLVAGAILISLLLGMALDSGWDQLGFELVRRLPAAIIVAGLLLWLRPSSQEGDVRDEAGDHPSLTGALASADWVSAAGNYVEAHGANGVRLLRLSLRQAEALLRPHGFVRVHRSTLVRQAMIARVEPRHVLLRGGRRLRLGTRYRSAL